METNFNFKSSVCTSKEQSERLLALGLKKETADMVWHFTPSRSQALQWELNPHPPVTKNNCHFNIDRLNAFGHKKADGTLMTGEEYFNELWGKDIPAWSLHRLIEMTKLKVTPFLYGVEISHPLWERAFVKRANVWDNLCDCIEWLIKEGYFPKEYLV